VSRPSVSELYFFVFVFAQSSVSSTTFAYGIHQLRFLRRSLFLHIPHIAISLWSFNRDCTTARHLEAHPDMTHCVGTAAPTRYVIVTKNDNTYNNYTKITTSSAFAALAELRCQSNNAQLRLHVRSEQTYQIPRVTGRDN
jgi:hypothetical protein